MQLVGVLAYSGSYDFTFRVWDVVAGGKPVHCYSVSGAVTRMIVMKPTRASAGTDQKRLLLRVADPPSLLLRPHSPSPLSHSPCVLTYPSHLVSGAYFAFKSVLQLPQRIIAVARQSAGVNVYVYLFLYTSA